MNKARIITIQMVIGLITIHTLSNVLIDYFGDIERWFIGYKILYLLFAGWLGDCFSNLKIPFTQKESKS